jgi:hypothetical protein
MPLAAFNLDKMQGQSIALTPQPPLPLWGEGGQEKPLTAQPPLPLWGEGG